MSNVRAVIVEESSTPLNTISLLLVADFITKLEESLLNLPNSVPPSFNRISAPSASIVRSPGALNSDVIIFSLALTADAVTAPVSALNTSPTFTAFVCWGDDPGSVTVNKN